VLFNGAIECRLALFELQPRPATHGPALLSPGATMVANRIRRNLRVLRKPLAHDGVTCFRVYDADLPEYAAAIDVYRGWPDGAATIGNDEAAVAWLHVQEYAPPESVDADAARRRWRDLQHAAGVALEVPRERLVAKTRRRGPGGARYGRFTAREEYAVVMEGGLRFLVDLRGRIDTGLFLDHRTVRGWIRERARGRDVLNLFAYTGTASVYAAAGGARSTTSVDLSQRYLEWAARNLELNGFVGDAQRLARADAMTFLRSERRQYGLIYVDPPTFSNSARAADFDVQRDHVALLEACGRRLDRDGVIVFSNNFRRFTLNAEALARTFAIEDVGTASVPVDFARRPRIHGCWILRKRLA